TPSLHDALPIWRRYILAQDETFRTNFCPWGSARIFDVTDETHPTQVSTFSLKVQDPANCPQALADNAMYSAHYLGVDNPYDARLAFFKIGRASCREMV